MSPYYMILNKYQEPSLCVMLYLKDSLKKLIVLICIIKNVIRVEMLLRSAKGKKN